MYLKSTCFEGSQKLQQSDFGVLELLYSMLLESIVHFSYDRDGSVDGTPVFFRMIGE